MYWNRQQKQPFSTDSAPIRRKRRRSGNTHFVGGDVRRRGLITLSDRLPREDHVDGAGIHQPGDASVRTHWRHSTVAVTRLEMYQNATKPSRFLTSYDVFGASDIDRLHLLFPQLHTHTKTTAEVED